MAPVMLTNPGAITLGIHLAMNDTVSFIQCTGNLEAIAKMHLQRECICCTGTYTILESCLTVCMKLTHRYLWWLYILQQGCWMICAGYLYPVATAPQMESQRMSIGYTLMMTCE